MPDQQPVIPFDCPSRRAGRPITICDVCLRVPNARTPEELRDAKRYLLNWYEFTENGWEFRVIVMGEEGRDLVGLDESDPRILAKIYGSEGFSVLVASEPYPQGMMQ